MKVARRVPRGYRTQNRQTTSIVHGLRGTEGAAMCDEYSESRVRMYWRAMAHEPERELDETKEEETIRPIGIDPPTGSKAKPKTLAR